MTQDIERCDICHERLYPYERIWCSACMKREREIRQQRAAVKE